MLLVLDAHLRRCQCLNDVDQPLAFEATQQGQRYVEAFLAEAAEGRLGVVVEVAKHRPHAGVAVPEDRRGVGAPDVVRLADVGARRQRRLDRLAPAADVVVGHPLRQAQHLAGEGGRAVEHVEEGLEADVVAEGVGFVGPLDDETRQAARTEGYQHASPHLCLVGQFVRHEVGEDLVDRQRKDNADGHRIAGDGLKKAANDIIRMRGATMVS